MDTPNRVLLRDQARRCIRQHMRRERLGVGKRLPSEQDLAVQLGVSRVTVRAALDDLVAEGRVRREARRGTFVAREEAPARTAIPGGRAAAGPALHLSLDRPAVTTLRYGTRDCLVPQGESYPGQCRMWRRIVDAFHHRHPSIRVEMEFLDEADLRHAVAGHEHALPDVVQLNHAEVPAAVDAGLLLNITPLVDATPDLRGTSWVGSVGNDGLVDGQWYGLPLECSIRVAFIRKSLFRRAGLDWPIGAWDYPDWLDLCRRFQGRLPQGSYATACTGSLRILDGFGALTRDADGELMLRLRGRPIRAALEYLREMVTTPSVWTGPHRVTSDLFLTGRLALFPIAVLELMRIHAQQDSDVALAAPAATPGVPEKRITALACLVRGCRDPLAAWEFMRFLTGPEAQRELARGKGNLPVREDAISSSDFLDGPVQPMQVLADLYRGSEPLPAYSADFRRLVDIDFTDELALWLRTDRDIDTTVERLRLRQALYRSSRPRPNQPSGAVRRARHG